MNHMTKAVIVALTLSVSPLPLDAQDAGGPPNPGPRPRGQFRPLEPRAPRPPAAAQAPGEDRPGPARDQAARPPAPPLFAALDANHDGVIDADEIANAPAALRTLDKNNDGKLTIDELRPLGPGPRGPGGAGAGLRREGMLKRYDANDDGHLDQADRQAARAEARPGEDRPPGPAHRGPRPGRSGGGLRGPGGHVPAPLDGAPPEPRAE